MSKYSIDIIRHSAAHLMAAAVQELFPNAKFDIGPSTADGFYYDFDLEERLIPEDLKKIENTMKKLINKRLPFECFESSRKDAEKLLKDQNQTFKIERLQEIPEDEKITFYKLGEFVDLCRGPHVGHSGEIGVVKLLSIAGILFSWQGK